MIVDDSAVARGFLRRWIESEPGIEIVEALRTGRQAIERLPAADPDVVVLDIEMPDMDGVTALPRLLQLKPGLAVIMASTLTRRNAEITLRALALGALDCIQKPDMSGGMTSESYRHGLIAKIRELGARARRKAGMPLPVPPAVTKPVAADDVPSRAVRLRARPSTPPRVLVIGASTGGPQALSEVCARLGPVVDQAPVLIVQHIPPVFTAILAEHLSRATGRDAREAQDGEAVRAGRIYVAPGQRHLRIARAGGQPVVALDDGAPVCFCKPSVDVMFASAAQVWGERVQGVILTGMGTDGTRGAAEIVAAGGAVMAQDESTSIVWGMPGSAAAAGLCSAVLPLPLIAPELSRLFAGVRA